MVSSVYQLREALAMLAEEGLEAAWARHQQMADRLYEGLKQVGRLQERGLGICASSKRRTARTLQRGGDLIGAAINSDRASIKPIPGRLCP